jgi:hypothetical protein
MRKLKVVCIVLVLVTAAAAVLAKDQIHRNVILLKDGRVIPFDRVWEAGADLFYENEKEIHFVRQADIQAMGRQSFTLFLHAGTGKIADYTRSCWDGIRAFFRPTAPNGHVNWLPWLVLGSMAVPAVLFFTLRFLRGRPKTSVAPKTVAAPPEPLELPGRSDVVRFFLQLYRQQIGAPPEAPAEFGQLPGVSNGANTVYELRVRNGADWVKRRMAIGPLGEDSGSRSKCFYVIFDQHLVVKIPPKPITQLEDYLTGIRKESHIVERLAPKECIIPKVSVILGQVHRLPPGVETLPEQVEEKYITWLRQNPEHQECLKIKGTFVFFMDLSRYYFLSHIIDGLHDLSAPLRAEIAGTPDLIRHPAGFKERYGAANDAVGFDVRDLYNQAEAEARRLLQAGAASATVTPHHIQCWFLSYLETRGIGDGGPVLPAEVRAALEAAFRRLFEKHSAAVDDYFTVVRTFARKLTLEQNRAAISGVITHLLELLGWLSEREVAMRDLKPDNLLVAGDPQNYPGFLRSPADYSLGFIDVETAVYCGGADTERVKQPLLGGTPYYATPSHLFPNMALAAGFGDPTRILRLQDWQSILVMVYRTVTGRLLFERTAKCFAEIKACVIQAMRRGEPLGGHLEQASRDFWSSAAGEFQLKMKGAEKALRFVEADIPKTAAAVFARVLTGDIRSLTETARRLIEAQSAFPSAGSREQLLAAPRERVDRIAAELQAKAGPAKATDTVLATLEFLRRLSVLKAKAERKAQLAEALSGRAACRMSAYDILVLLFDCVLTTMLPEEWRPALDRPGDAPAAVRDELSLATTV